MSLIQLKNLKLGYGKNVVLSGLNLTIEEGDFVCIVGPNGAGKTTLVRGILGLIKPLSGEIQLGSLSQNSIGYMPQEITIDPNFPASVHEIVLSGTLNQVSNFYNDSARNLADRALKLLDISKIRDQNFSELSGGQRQRVLLARALAATKKLLILDEPSNSLDQASKRTLYDLIKKINTEKKIAIIMVTHDLDHDNLIGNKILSLRQDDIFFGSTKDFVRKVHHE